MDHGFVSIPAAEVDQDVSEATTEQAATAKIIEHTGTQIGQTPPPTALHAQPGNDADSMASPAVATHTLGGKSGDDRGYPNARHVHQRGSA